MYNGHNCGIEQHTKISDEFTFKWIIEIRVNELRINITAL